MKILSVGDMMLQLISGVEQHGAYQRTLLADWGDAELGGAAWNAAWYLGRLGWDVELRTHHGADAEGCAPLLLPGGADALRGSCRKRSATDRLLVFPRVAMPAIYLLGALEDAELDRICAGMAQAAVLVFAGSRHAALRRRFLAAIAAPGERLVVFSPSYTLYEYGAAEIRDFIAGADIVAVNRHEAEFLVSVLGVADIAAAFAPARRGGVVTRDEDGADLYPRGGAMLHLPSMSGVRGDVIGAGEAFLCGWIDGLLRGAALADAARMGIAVAAQTARRGLICTPTDAAAARRAAGLG